MKDLALRLAALDPDACAALRVIAQFDQLTSCRAGLPTIVREAAVLAGCPARLVDAERRLSVRVEPDGAARPGPADIEPDWLSTPLPGEAAARLWLERPGPAGPVAAMVLERASVTAAAVLRRTRSAGSRAMIDDPARVELILDASVPLADRLRAARGLGLAPEGLARAVAVHGGPPMVEPLPAAGPGAYHTRRAGIGPSVPVAELPSSWAGARTALRFTASGTPADPGPRIVAYDDLGGLVLLAAVMGPTSASLPDVVALGELATSMPWALETLVAVTESGSGRAAAAALRIHHSTLQDRVSLIEHQLGWGVHDQRGRLRLQLALIVRRLHQNRS